MIGNLGTASVIFVALAIWLIWINSNFVNKFNAWIDRITAPKAPKAEKAEKSKKSTVETSLVDDSKLSDDTIFELNPDEMIDRKSVV